MAGEWRQVTVGDLADSISDTHKFGKDRLIFLNTSDVLRGKILNHSYSAVRYWPGQAKKSICKGDILFSEIRPANGRWAYVDIEADDYVVSTKLMVIRPRTSLVLPRFLYHFLTSTNTTRWLQHLAESRSGTFPQITFDQIAELQLALPSLTVQSEIAGFLDIIDDKIELNRRMNETLVEMARALFKLWFVDFDPVRAKIEGRWKRAQSLPGLPALLYDLFPDCLVDSERGEIPEGWEVKPIGDVVQVLGGGTPSTNEYRFWTGGRHAFCTPKDMSSLESPVLLETERYLTDDGVTKVSSGQLPVGTVLLSSRAPIGYLAITEIPISINQGIIAMVCGSLIPNLYILFWARMNMDVIEANANGSTFMEISKKNFRPIPIVVPSKPILQQFYRHVGPFYERIAENMKDMRALAALRDVMLPKLISGKLRVKVAEKFIGRPV